MREEHVATKDRARPLKIRGIGRYLPSRRIVSGDLETELGLEAGWIEANLGVRQRYRVADPVSECASFMAAEASREALARAGMVPEELDLILNASGTPEQAIPDGGPLLQARLGLGDSAIPAFSVHATCLSFLVALDVATSFLETGRHARILIASSEIASVGLDRDDPTTYCLFGDAAVAVVVTRPDEGDDAGIVSSHFQTFGDAAELATLRGFGTRVGAARPDARFFQMNGPALLRFTWPRLTPFCKTLLDRVGSTPERAPLLVAHQASRHGAGLLRRLGFREERMIATLGDYGNTISASIPLGLEAGLRDRRFGPGDDVLLLGSGSGLSLAGAILRL